MINIKKAKWLDQNTVLILEVWKDILSDYNMLLYNHLKKEAGYKSTNPIKRSINIYTNDQVYYVYKKNSIDYSQYLFTCKYGDIKLSLKLK